MKSGSGTTHLTWSLSPAQHQYAHQCHFGMIQMHHFRHDVFVLWHSTRAAVENVDQILFAQTFYGLRNLVFGVATHRLSIVLLIACKSQRVEREWVGLRRGDLFLNE